MSQVPPNPPSGDERPDSGAPDASSPPVWPGADEPTETTPAAAEDDLEPLPPAPAPTPWGDVTPGSQTAAAAGETPPAAEPTVPPAATWNQQGGGWPSAPTGAAAGAGWGAPHNAGDPTVPSAPWAPAPSHAPANGGARGGGGMRAALIGGICGALIGALAAGGIVAATEHNNTRTVIEQPANAPAARTASVIQRAGDIAQILAKVRPAVVRIDVTISGGNSGGLGFGNTPQQGVGTGFIISPDGYIVTNAHVVENATSVRVRLDGGNEPTGHVVGKSIVSDLAVVKIDGKNLPTVTLGDSDSLQVGDQVVAIGNALGLEGEPTVTSGIVSGLDRVLQEPNGTNIPNTIQTDASINPGNSGGPLLDAAGQVVGINTAIADPSSSNNIGFAISINEAKSVIDALRKGQQPQLAFLGVGTETVAPDSPDLPSNLPVSQGAYVTSVSPGSAAASAGLKVGDVIVRVDNTVVNTSDDVINLVRRHAPGDKISVTVNRGGTEKTVSVTLRSRSAS
jgi:S1-C subfamily serine protease